MKSLNPNKAIEFLLELVTMCYMQPIVGQYRLQNTWRVFWVEFTGGCCRGVGALHTPQLYEII